jgi:O-antigen/teichoic acid export membrane protein
MSERKLAKNTVFYTAALAGQKVLSFFYFIILARGIGVENTGKFTFALSFTAIFAMVLDLGLTQVIIRETAKEPEKSEKYLASIMGFKLVGSLLVYILIVILVNVMGYPETTKDLVYVSALVMLVDCYTLSIYGVIRGKQNLFFESVGTVLNQAIVLVVGSALIFLKANLTVIMAVYLLASVANFLWAWFNLNKSFGLRLKALFDWPTWRFLLLLAAPFAVAGIFNRIFSSIDVVLLSRLQGDYEVGIYSVAFKVAFALQFVALAFLAAIYPAFSYYYAHEKERLSQLFVKAMYWLVFLAAPMSIGVISISDKVIVPVFGADYLQSVRPLNILMLSLMFVFLCFPVGALLNACGKQTRHTVNLGIVAGFSVLANLAMIPMFSYIGTAWVNLLSYFLLFVLDIIVVNSIIKYDKKFLLVSFLKTAVACGAMYLSVIVVKEQIHFILAVVIGAVVYFTIAYILGLFKFNSIKELAKDFRR